MLSPIFNFVMAIDAYVLKFDFLYASKNDKKGFHELKLQNSLK